MSNFPLKLSQELESRRTNGSLRSLKQPIDLLDFASNDYLGLSSNKTLINRIETAWNASEKKVGSTGSRLLTGNSSEHIRTEEYLTNVFNVESTLLFNSGYHANTGLLSSILKREDTIVFDQYCHASIREGIRLSGANNYGFRHNDLTQLASKLKLAKGEKYIVVESLYSMDGDFAPLLEIIEIAQKHKAKLIVDEAHSTGIYGPGGSGLCNQLGIGEKVFARVHTFGKAMGIHGACVTGSEELKKYLINFSKPFIYSTALPLHELICIRESFQFISINTEEKERLMDNIYHFQSEMGSGNIGPIQTVLSPGNHYAKNLANKVQEAGFLVYPILYPTVPEGAERIRICLHSFNSKADITKLVSLLK